MYNPYLPQPEGKEDFPPEKPRSGLDSGKGLLGGSLRDIFGKLHLDRLDFGDLLLLLVALLLWREGEERDFALALGLVLLWELFREEEP